MACASDGNQEGNDMEERELLEEPEDEKEVANETEEIFRNFVYHRLYSQIEQEAEEGDLNVANFPQRVLFELRERREENLSSASSCQDLNLKKSKELGKFLADVGDQINLKYHDTFQDMITTLELTPSTAYEAFAKIARRLFSNGINFGRIVSLLCFGYEIAVTVIRRGVESVGSFIRKIVKFVVQFVVQERIARWIADHGGWMSLVDFERNSSEIWAARFFFAAIVLAGVYVANNLKS